MPSLLSDETASVPSPAAETMQALVLPVHNDDLSAAVASLRVETLPVPVPGPGQVLVRIYAASCNPSDLGYLQGHYPGPATAPAIPGFEGAGVVVKAGPGWLGSWLIGRRVACGGSGRQGGTWAEYCVTEAEACIPIQKELTTEQAASLIVNPLTAMGLFDIAKRGGHRGAMQNAAGGQLARMVARLFADAKIPLINIVRRSDQAEELRAAAHTPGGMGHRLVLDSSQPDFEQKLHDTCKRYDVTIAFDALGGAATGLLSRSMPAGGKVVVYGGLDNGLCSGLDPYGIVFQRKTLQGFYLMDYAKEQGPLRMRDISHKAQRLIIRGKFTTHIRSRSGLAEFPAALQTYVSEMSGGKVLLVPSAAASLPLPPVVDSDDAPFPPPPPLES
jgi:NADPH:quinone reductase-like Zn-dependent oxidoreductase